MFIALLMLIATQVNLASAGEVCLVVDGNQKCFFKGKNRKLTSVASVVKGCKAIGGKDFLVATPLSEAENDVAWAACGERSILGYSDKGSEGTFFNVNDGSIAFIGDKKDLEAKVYQNFPPGIQPDNFFNEDFVEYNQFIPGFDLIPPTSWNDIGPGLFNNPKTICCEVTRPLCAKGITNGEGSVCCAAECGTCGGCECAVPVPGFEAQTGPDFCCPQTISRNEMFCTHPHDVGCLLDEVTFFPNPEGGCDAVKEW